jgi:hypothetical protein
VSATHIADTELFVAMGQPSNRRYQVVQTFVRRNDMTLVLPERFHDELTVNASDIETSPIDTAIDEGYARVAAPLEYTNARRTREAVDGIHVETPAGAAPSSSSVPGHGRVRFAGALA